MSGPEVPPGEPPENPLDSVFEKAVRPFSDTEALRAAFAPSTPVVLMRKGEDLQTETHETESGGKVTVPVLAALKGSKLTTWGPCGTFDFAGMGREDVVLLIEEHPGKPSSIKVVTRGAGSVVLVADLEGMLEGLAAVLASPAFKSFPGAEFLFEALVTGIREAVGEIRAALEKPDASGRSMLDEFRTAKGGPAR